MCPHHHTNSDSMYLTQGLTSSHNAHAGSKAPTSEDEVVAELDEPPDPILFSRTGKTGGASPLTEDGPKSSPHYRKASLLTQALLTSPDLTPMSDTDAPHLTSDGGMTSPTRTTTPSPPLPAVNYTGLPTFGHNDLLDPQSEKLHNLSQTPHALGIDRNQETTVEATLGRRRCISFACGKKTSVEDNSSRITKDQEQKQEQLTLSKAPPKRPCMLRFACPIRPLKCEPGDAIKASEPPELDQPALYPGFHQSSLLKCPSSSSTTEQHLSAPQDEYQKVTSVSSSRYEKFTKIPTTSQNSRPFNRIDFQRSEATSFHEFAGAYHTEDEWTNEQTAYRHKMTINDTLQKENAIRRLAEEAEEEALEEEDRGLNDDDGDGEIDDEDDADDLYANGSDGASDDGNESDDEEGFAESDDESEDGCGYQFWTPGLTTAATSTDHVEHIRSLTDRVASDSSIESMVKSQLVENANESRGDIITRRSRPGKTSLTFYCKPAKLEDFIIGTLDEDRPLQEAYLSTLEQRRRSKQTLIPQDIDPSFPTSDPEADEDGNESDDDDDDDDGMNDDSAQQGMAEYVVRQPDGFEEDQPRSRKSSSEKRDKTPAPSPKRLHPPPSRRLFGQSSHRLRSPPPQHRKLASPPSSRRPSPLARSPPNMAQGMEMPHLGQRPNLTHTASLPRTSNPFWDQHSMAISRKPQIPSEGTSPSTRIPAEADFHARDPVDIVQGLENKRQRRKEKFWRIHCQKAHAGKEKERRCMPGRGAERMREVGKEMQDRFKGYNRANLMLSV